MVYTFSCTIGLFISSDWELISYLVDFKPLEDKEHKGLYAGKALVDGARACGCLDKICLLFHNVISLLLTFLIIYFSAITTDNASAIGEVDKAPDKLNYFELHKGESVHFNIETDEEQIGLENEALDYDLNIPASEEYLLEKEEHAVRTESPLKRVCS